MVAVPLAPTVERDHEQVRCLQPPKLRVSVTPLEERIAEGGTELIQDRRTPQEALNILRQLHERLAVEVIGHVSVVPGDRRRLVRALVRDQRSEVQARRPTLGALGHRLRHRRAELDLRLREDLARARRVEGEVAGAELHRLTLRPQPGQVRLLVTARSDELRPRRDPRDRDPQRVVAGRRAHHVEVIQHEHERLGAHAERRSEARSRASQDRHAQASHVGGQRLAVGRDPSVRRGQAEHQGCGIIVEAVERHPRDRAILRACPLGQQGRFAVPGGRGHPHDAAMALARSSDQGSPTHGARPGARHRELGIEQRQSKASDRGREPFGSFVQGAGLPTSAPSFSVGQPGVNITRFA